MLNRKRDAALGAKLSPGRSPGRPSGGGRGGISVRALGLRGRDPKRGATAVGLGAFGGAWGLGTTGAGPGSGSDRYGGSPLARGRSALTDDFLGPVPAVPAALPLALVLSLTLLALSAVALALLLAVTVLSETIC